MPSPRSGLLTAALTLPLLACAGQAGAVAAEMPPAEMARVYAVAGARFGVAPELLAAIGYNESRHGRSRLPGVRSGVNRAGCCAGPAQLCVMRSCGLVWQRYRVDADGRRRVHDRDDGRALRGRVAANDPLDSARAPARGRRARRRATPRRRAAVPRDAQLRPRRRAADAT